MLYSVATLGTPRAGFGLAPIRLVVGTTAVHAVIGAAGPDVGRVLKLLQERITASSLRTAEECYQVVYDCALQAHNLGCQLYFSGLFEFKTFVCYATFQGSVFLRRDAHAAQLLETGREVGFVKGFWKEGDTAVLSTLPAREIVAAVREQLARGFALHSLPSSTQVAIKSLADSSLAGLVLVGDEPFGDSMPMEEVRRHTPSVARTAPPDTARAEPVDPEPELPAPIATESTLRRFSSPLPRINTISTVLRQMGAGVLPLLHGVARWVRHLRLRYAAYCTWCVVRDGSRYLGSQLLLTLQGKKRRPQVARSRAESNQLRARGLLLLGAVIGISATIGLLLLWRSRVRMRTTQQVATEQLSDQPSSISAQLETAQSVPPRPELAQFGTALSSPDGVPPLSAVGPEYAVAFDQESSALEVYPLASAAAELDQPSRSVSVELPARPQAVSIGVNRVFFVLDGIWQLDLTEAEPQPIKIRSAGNSNATIAQLQEYAGAVYALNPLAGQLYRYVEGDPGVFGQPIGWFQDQNPVVAEEVVDMVVAESVWLALRDGTIRQFRSGTEEPFLPVGSVLTGEVVLATTADIPELYAIERNTGRVLSIDKQSGQASVLIDEPSLAGVLDAVVRADGSLAVLLADGVVPIVTE